MPWVPFAESDIADSWAFEAEMFGGLFPEMSGSYVTGADTYAGWDLIGLTTRRIRLTVESYSRENFEGPDAEAYCAGFLYPSTPLPYVYNKAADPTIEFSPPVYDTELEVNQVTFFPPQAMGGRLSHSFNILVEVWQEGPSPPDPPSSDCDCDGGPEPIPGYAGQVEPEAPETAPVAVDPSLPNCDCEDDTIGRRTLGELRDAVMAGLGFYDVLGRGPQKTLCQMRCSVLGALNLGSTKQAPGRTLGAIRAEVIKMTGFAAMVPSPPGFGDMVNAFINEAQQVLWRRLETSRGNETEQPAWLAADGDVTRYDGAAVQTLAVGLVKAHYNKPDAAAYDKYVETYLQGLAQRTSPVTNEQIDNALRRARYTVWNRGEALPAMVDDDDYSTIHFLPIELLAIANLKARLNQADAANYRKDFEKYIGDTERRSPGDAVNAVKRLIQSAQEQLYRRYDVLRTERFYSWPITAGTRLYDIPENQEECSKRLDARKISWVGIERDDIWTPLRCGIPPELYSHSLDGTPQRYEIRQCIELWPTPDETRGRLVIKGRFGLEPFTEDYHRTTIDDQAVFLLALANAKAQYGQSDGPNYTAQLETLISGLVAGSHHTRTYVPGNRRPGDRTYAIPRTTEPFP